MTTPFISVSAAILYFGWLWHDRSAVARRGASLESQLTKETIGTRKVPLARAALVQTPVPKPFNLKNRATVPQEGLAQ